jgi:hypothetical protein
VGGARSFRPAGPGLKQARRNIGGKGGVSPGIGPACVAQYRWESAERRRSYRPARLGCQTIIGCVPLSSCSPDAIHNSGPACTHVI